MWFLYILKSENNKYYTGITKDLNTRIKEHRSGYGGKYSKRFKELNLVYFEKLQNRAIAEQRELQIKGWSKAKKKALIDSKFSDLRRLSKSKNPEIDEDSS